MEPQIRYVRTSDGVRIATYRLGEREPGVPLVIAAPYTLATFTSEWKLPDIREGYTRLAANRPGIAYDPRGYAFSDREVTDFSLDARVRDLLAVVESVDAKQVNLLGRAHSCLVAIAYAAEHPKRVARMILSAGMARARDLRLVGSRRALGPLMDVDWELYLAASALSDFGWDYGKIIAEDMARNISREVVQLQWRAFSEADVSDRLSRVACPVLVTTAAVRDPERSYVPLDAARRLAADLPDARLAELPSGRTPALFVGAAEENARVFNEFLAEGDEPTVHEAAPSGMSVIFFADIADSTALTESLGDAAFRAKARELDSALRTTIQGNGGTCIDAKTLGDGVLATFASAAKAIEAALACGRAGDEAGLPLHLGLHAGDVIREEGNVFGGAVNIAARISGLSAPGEVLVSDTVRALARTSADVSFEDRGERSLKGVGEPVRVYEVGWR